jgi:hypothetical protein
MPQHEYVRQGPYGHQDWKPMLYPVSVYEVSLRFKFSIKFHALTKGRSSCIILCAERMVFTKVNCLIDF